MYKGEWTLKGDTITGWAQQDSSPSALWLELLADEEVIGICLAHLREPDNCGFAFTVPPAILADETELKVRIANTSEFIGQTIQTAKPVPALLGEIQVDRSLHISGWALDPSRTNHKLPVYAFIEDKIVAQTVAAEKRYRPVEADGHGFSLELPLTYADGQSYIVSLKDDKGRTLPGSPFKIRNLAKNASAWLKTIKKADKPLFDLIGNLFESMEERLPGLISQARYSDWKKVFPVDAPKNRHKFSLEIYGDKRVLKNQQGVEAKIGSDKPDYILLCPDGCSLHPYFLGHMVESLVSTGASLAYADHELPGEEPYFKPAWDRETFLHHDYLGPVLLKASLLSEIGGPKSDLNQTRFDLILAAANKQIVHMPQPLSTCAWLDRDEKIVQNWLDQNYPGGKLTEGQIIYPIKAKPRVSIIIPTRDHGDLLATCLNSLAATDWPDYEIIIIDNGTSEEYALKVLAEAKAKANVKILDMPGVFNYAHLNNQAAAKASGEYLCFLNNDTEALAPDWLTALMAMAFIDESSFGCAGAKLIWPNGLVQHGGVIVGAHQLAMHAGNSWLADDPGYMGRNQYAQQYSAVTAACLLTPTRLFLETEGFDARRFPIAFNDVDYCLRLAERGKKIYWTPASQLYHHESASRGKDASASAKARSEREMNFFRTRWGHFADPFYNPNLSLSSASEPFGGLAFPPRSRKAR